MPNHLDNSITKRQNKINELSSIISKIDRKNLDEVYVKAHKDAEELHKMGYMTKTAYDQMLIDIERIYNACIEIIIGA